MWTETILRTSIKVEEHKLILTCEKSFICLLVFFFYKYLLRGLSKLDHYIKLERCLNVDRDQSSLKLNVVDYYHEMGTERVTFLCYLDTYSRSISNL